MPAGGPPGAGIAWGPPGGTSQRRCVLKRRLAVLALSAGVMSGLFAGFATSANATSLPALCVREPTPIGQIQIGYCPT